MLIQDVFFLSLIITCNTSTPSLFFFSWTFNKTGRLGKQIPFYFTETLEAHRPDRSETILNQAKNETLATACKSKQEDVLENICLPYHPASGLMQILHFDWLRYYRSVSNSHRVPKFAGFVNLFIWFYSQIDKYIYIYI